MVSSQFSRPNSNFIVVGTTIEMFSRKNKGEDIGGVAFKGADTLVTYGAMLIKLLRLRE